MPQTLRSSEMPPPPSVMTWPKASPVLVVAVISWALGVFFDSLLFLGPALADVACTGYVGGKAISWTAGLLGYKTAAIACTAAIGAGVASISVATGGTSTEAIEGFGTLMAMIIGFIGWLGIGFWLLMKNPQIYEDNALWFGTGLLASVIPFVDALPGFLGTLFKMYSNQIKKDKERFAAWKKEQGRLAEERAAETTALIQAQAVMEAQEQEVANDAAYEQELADELPSNIIPLPERKTRKPLVDVPQYMEKAA